MLKRVTAALLTLILLSTAGLAAFTDTASHWANEYIGDLSGRGLVKGYEDGTFLPEKSVTNLEALVFTSRLCGADAATAAKIVAKHQTYLKGILPSGMHWAVGELAVAIEAGVTTREELKSLADASRLSVAATKENLAVWIVRAIRLENEAKSLSSYTMSFNDVNSISASARPYVFLLTLNSIVEGTPENTFEPKSSVTRAVTVTMLSRALEYMEEQGVEVEFYDYSSYSFEAGLVTSATLSGDDLALKILNLAGVTKSYTVSDSAAVYCDGVLSDFTTVAVDSYVRVCFNSLGSVDALRVDTIMFTESGEIESYKDGYLTTSTGVYAANRFTQVTAGGVFGGVALLDDAGDYISAECLVDYTGRLLAVKLGGGSNIYTGLLSQAGSSWIITGTDGVSRVFKAESTVRLGGEVLSSAQSGSYVRAEADRDSGKIISLAYAGDSDFTYVLGAISTLTRASSRTTFTVSDLCTGEAVGEYKVSSNMEATIGNSKTTAASLTAGYFVFLAIEDGVISEISAVAGTRTVTGTVTGVTLGAPIVLEVEVSDGEVEAFPITVTKLPTVRIDGVTSSVDKLTKGVSITVNVKSAAANTIVATTPSETIKGTVQSVSIGTTSTLVFTDGDGKTSTYALAGSYTVEYKSSTIQLSDVIGGTVELTIKNGLVTAVTLVSYSSGGTGTGTSGDTVELSGTVLFINYVDNYFLLTPSSGSDITVYVNSSTNMMSASGAKYSISTLPQNSEVQVYCTVSGTTHTATVVIVK